MLPYELTKDTPYLALSGELWSVFYEYFNRNWPCYKGFLLYYFHAVTSMVADRWPNTKYLVSSLIIQLWSKSSRKPIGPSDIAPDFAKCLMICSKSSDILCDHLQTFSWMIEFKCLIIFFQKCLMISYKSSDILDHRDCHQISNIRHTVVGNKIVNHSNVVGASPIGVNPTTSSFSI